MTTEERDKEQDMSEQAVIDAHSEPVEPDGEATAEPAQPEVVHLPERRQAQLDVAEQAAVTLSQIPGKEELLSLAMEAKMLAYGNLVPAALRGKPADVFLILLVGRDLGIAQTSALQQVYVVDGKPSLAPKLLNARLRHLRLGGIYPHPDNSKTWAAALVVPWAGVMRLDAGEQIDGRPLTALDVAMGKMEFSWQDAADAELVTGGCEPGAHLGWCSNKNAHIRQSCGKCHCKDNYRKYPQRMLWWRAAGYAADDYFPEASLGLYSPDELGAVTDEDGKPLDPRTVDVPDGFARGARGEGDEDDEAPASGEVLWALQERIAALPDEQRAEFKQRWVQTAGLKAPNGGVYPAWHVPATKLKLVHSILAGCEAQAKPSGWNADKERLRVQVHVADTAAEALRGLLCFSVAAPVIAPWPAALEDDQPDDQAPDFGRCEECGAAITAEEHERLSADTDFIEHGEPAHLIRRVLDSAPEPPEAPPQAAPEAAADEPEPWVQEIIEAVRKMDITEVDEQIYTRSLPKGGSQKVRRQRLAASMVHDHQRTTT